MSRLLLLLAGACLLALCPQPAAAQEEDPSPELRVGDDDCRTSDEFLKVEESTDNGDDAVGTTTEPASRNGALHAGSKQSAHARTAAHAKAAKARTAGKSRTAANARTAAKKEGRAAGKAGKAKQ